jgi:hypothetical protein
MKKAIYLLMGLAGLLFTSCEKDEIGGTATEALAGEWYVTAEAVDEVGNLVYSDDDLFGMGHFMLNTYNTAANVANQLYVDDRGNFWEFMVRVQSDADALTFQSNGPVANESYDCDVTIEDGKILPGAATNPHGTAADSIVFYVSFSDDAYPAAYGYAKYRISGYRYTGLTSDDD